MSTETRAAWDALDPSGPPRVTFVREPSTAQISVLLGAFDPPTTAHLAVVGAAARASGSSGVLCLTKTLLARPDDELLPIDRRLDVLDEIAAERGLGLALASHGTYVDVAEALAADGRSACFVIGSDKLEQLEDPSFYRDGEAGVARTFANVSFIVVPRPRIARHRSASRHSALRWLDVADVFERPGDEALSATEVRRRVRAGEPFADLVPQAVAAALRGYTSLR